MKSHHLSICLALLILLVGAFSITTASPLPARPAPQTPPEPATAGNTTVSATLGSGTCGEGGGVVASQPSSTNLLSNPGAETGDLSGWGILDNGGDGWATTTSHPHEGTHAFITSYNWDTRYQEIDLLAAGFSAEYLDGAPPVAVGEWFRGYEVDTADHYYIRVELRDAAHAPIASWNVGTKAAPVTATAEWTEQAATFTGYGSGLRYLYFEDGGDDIEYWSGHYGTQMDDAYATIATGHWVLFPVVLRHHPWDPYCEPNNDWLNAFGPLASDRVFEAYPDDENDYFYFTLSDARMVDVVVSNYKPTSAHGDLMVYGPADGDLIGPLVKNFGDPRYHTEMRIAGLELGAGKYYVLVYTTVEGYSSDQLYTLRVTY